MCSFLVCSCLSRETFAVLEDLQSLIYTASIYLQSLIHTFFLKQLLLDFVINKAVSLFDFLHIRLSIMINMVLDQAHPL